jgi:type II secretory pathway component PulK
MAIDRSYVAEHARLMQQLEIGDRRAEELAAELNGLMQGIAPAEQRCQFEDEPGDFLTALLRLREE